MGGSLGPGDAPGRADVLRPTTQSRLAQRLANAKERIRRRRAARAKKAPDGSQPSAAENHEDLHEEMSAPLELTGTRDRRSRQARLARDRRPELSQIFGPQSTTAGGRARRRGSRSHPPRVTGRGNNGGQRGAAKTKKKKKKKRRGASELGDVLKILESDRSPCGRA